MASKISLVTMSLGFAEAWHRIIGPVIGWNSAKKMQRIWPTLPQPVQYKIQFLKGMGKFHAKYSGNGTIRVHSRFEF